MSHPEQEQVIETEADRGGKEGESPSFPQQPAEAQAGGEQQAPPQDGTEAASQQVGAQEEREGEREEAAPQGGGAEPERQLEVDMEALLTAAAQRDEYLALAQRTQADFENYKKRVAKENAAAVKRGIVQLARELLPALDNLERALAEAAGREGADGDPFIEGIRLVHRELIAALERVGISSYSPLGEQFDPNSQEAMAQREAGEGEQAGTVVEVYQPGYKLEELVIRPARVVVAL